MTRPRFLLASDQLELLLAFAAAPSLAALAEVMAKDASVISRQLTRLADTAPVIEKVNGRWTLTPLGEVINVRSAAFVTELANALGEKPVALPSKLKAPILLVINGQVALRDRTPTTPGQIRAEMQIAKVLAAFRAHNLGVIHVRHKSTKSNSPFHPQCPGFAFLEPLRPDGNEAILDKATANAFTGTGLAEQLQERGCSTVVITGFTANECIDATARHAATLAFTTIVVGDASASFEIRGPDGVVHPAERVHQLTLANLHHHVAQVVTTAALIPQLPKLPVAARPKS